MTTEKPFSEQESLRLITEMIQKAKTGQFHESGSSAILWGSVIGLAGFMTFAEQFWQFETGINWWFLPLIALVPQFIIVRMESRNIAKVKSHEERALDTVWLVFGISIFCLVAYANIVPGVSDQILASQGIELLQRNVASGDLKSFRMFPPSVMSLMILIYAFPTIVTGIVQRFRPMVVGALLCYLFFIISLFTTSTWDNLLTSMAGIFNWLIPGLILRRLYKANRKEKHV